MKQLIKQLKDLSMPGVLGIHLGDRKIRIVSSSNFVSSLQRLLPELTGGEKVEVLSSNIADKKLRSIMCYIHKKRLERLGYKITKCSVKRWWLDKKIEIVDGGYRWVVRVKNTYNGMVIGIFTKDEMDEFLSTYYPGGMISAVIFSSNEATRKFYEIHKEG